MSPRRSALLAAPVIVAAAILAPAATAAAEAQIVIEAGALRPAALRTTVDERVNFVNRSGRLIHVEFLGEAAAHRVFQVPDRIWAVFHRPGAHPYVVHVPGRGDLQGMIEVEYNFGERQLPVCGGALTVMGECLER